MKKYLSLLLCVMLLLALTACGKDTPKEDIATTTQSTTTTTTAGGVSGTTATTTTTVDGAATDATTTTTATGSGATVPIDGTTATTIPGETTTVGTATGSATSATAGGTTTTTTTTVPTTTTTVVRPNVLLPAIGTDIDLTKKKGRILVVDADAVYDTDGSILVTLTVENKDKTYITEETDYVVYTCYDKSGNLAQKATQLYLGCIDTKENKKKSYTFNVPANTAEVRITRSKITYWTEWS